MRVLKITAFIALIGVVSCSTPLERNAKHYREHQDAESLREVVRLFPKDADTSTVKTLLGDPIDFGFDYRYLTEEVSENNCAVGAVFHLSDGGKIDDYWYGEICE